jgi:hypothetical protein
MTVCPMGQLKASDAASLPLDPGGDGGSVAPDQGRRGVAPDTLASCCTRGGDEPRRAWNGGGDGGGEGTEVPAPAPTPAPASGEAAPTPAPSSGEAAPTPAPASGEAAATVLADPTRRVPAPAEPAREPGAPTIWTTSALAASWRSARVTGRASASMLLAELLLTRQRPEKAAGAAGGGGAARLREERPAPEAYRLSTSVRWLGVGVGVG